MTRLHERIETPLPIDEAFAFVADFANAQVGPRRRHVASGSTPARSASGPAIASASGWAAGSRRWSTGSRVFEPPTRVVLDGSGSGVSAVDDIRFERDRRRDPDRLHGRHPARWVLRLVQPFLGGAFANIARNAAAACSGRSTRAAPAAAPRRDGSDAA